MADRTAPFVNGNHYGQNGPTLVTGLASFSSSIAENKNADSHDEVDSLHHRSVLFSAAHIVPGFGRVGLPASLSAHGHSCRGKPVRPARHAKL